MLRVPKPPPSSKYIVIIKINFIFLTTSFFLALTISVNAADCRAFDRCLLQQMYRNETYKIRNGFGKIYVYKLWKKSNEQKKSSTKKSTIRLQSDEQLEKPTKMKMLYVEAIKIERANVKIHINYCNNSNLYALFTCFVFIHHSSGHKTQTSTSRERESLPWWTICLCCDHFGFTILFRCNFLRVFFPFHCFAFLFEFCIISASSCHWWKPRSHIEYIIIKYELLKYLEHSGMLKLNGPYFEKYCVDAFIGCVSMPNARTASSTINKVKRSKFWNVILVSANEKLSLSARDKRKLSEKIGSSAMDQVKKKFPANTNAIGK